MFPFTIQRLAAITSINANSVSLEQHCDFVCPWRPREGAADK